MRSINCKFLVTLEVFVFGELVHPAIPYVYSLFISLLYFGLGLLSVLFCKYIRNLFDHPQMDNFLYFTFSNLHLPDFIKFIIPFFFYLRCDFEEDPFLIMRPEDMEISGIYSLISVFWKLSDDFH